MSDALSNVNYLFENTCSLAAILIHVLKYFVTFRKTNIQIRTSNIVLALLTACYQTILIKGNLTTRNLEFFAAKINGGHWQTRKWIWLLRARFLIHFFKFY